MLQLRSGGNLVAHIRMDGAWIGSIDIAINKAFTARTFDLATKDWLRRRSRGRRSTASRNPTAGVSWCSQAASRCSMAGRSLGAAGVSGGTGVRDQEVAEAAAAAL